MKRFAAVANAGASHQMTMCAIGRELQKRGHHFTLLGTAFQRKQMKLNGIPFEVLDDAKTDPARRYVECASEKVELPISATIEYMNAMANLLCQEAPPILKRLNIDFVLADQEEPGAATAAEMVGLPYASICSSLPLNEAPDVPPGFFAWRYSPCFAARVRNRAGYAVRNLIIGSLNRTLNKYRRTAGLRPCHKPDDTFSPLAQITQLVQEFDFPRESVLPALFYVGPFQRQALSPVEFPFESLNGKPLIYASFGTTFGAGANLRAIAEACSNLPVQLVISLGGGEPTSEHRGLPGSPIVARYVPQRDILARSALAITHAGLNTTLEALSLGVPLLALPVAGDQLGTAARITYRAVGRTLDQKCRSAQHLKEAISELLDETGYRKSAKRLQEAIGRTEGAAQAAEILERLI